MFRYIIVSIFILALSFTTFISCSSKEKKIEEPDSVGALDESPAPPPSPSFPELGSDSGQIPGLRTVHFDYDRSSLSTAARQTLAENANWIQEQSSSILVQVEGHCDNRGSVEYNLALGERRAKAVRDYLVSLGVDSQKLSAISYGKEKPLNTAKNEVAFTTNRRANFVPLPQ